MKYRIKRVAWVLLFMMLVISGCSNGKKGTVSGTNYYYPEEMTETKPSEKEEKEAVKAEFAPEHYMIKVNNMTREYMLLQQMESGKQYIYAYSLTTRFEDKYGNNTSVSEFEPGCIITIGKTDSEEKLKSARISEDVWEYEDVVRFKIDEERGIFQIADTKYYFGEDIFVVSAGNELDVSEIKEEDELRIIGMNKEILSVTVTTGQGTILLKNTELFEDSFIQIGNKIFAEITGEMSLEVPEGTYMVTVANKGYGGSKEYEIIRDEVTEIDLDELKGEGPKMGSITFKIGTTDEKEADITFKIDGKAVKYGKPIELAYGIHSIAAEAFGYETYAKKLFVNSEEATITIALDKEVSSASQEKDEEEASNGDSNTSSQINTDLAGSLAGSTANNNSGNTTGSGNSNEDSTGELVGALIEALGGSSSTDYLSTLTELLGNVMQ